MVCQISSPLDGSIVSGPGTEVSFDDITAAYDAGIPLFSKTTLRVMSAQLQRYREGTLERTPLRVIGVDGREVEYVLGALVTGDGVGEYAPHQEFFAATFARIKEYHGNNVPFEGHDAATIAARAKIDKMPPAELRTIFLEKEGKWKKTEPFVDEMHRIWDDRDIASAGIDKIVAFACGPLIWDSKVAVQSILQHGLLLSLRDYLLGKGEQAGECPCYVQDPAYSDRDKDVLKSLGITTLEDPAGFFEADDRSIVLSFYPNVPVKQIIADLCRPAVIIWSLPADLYPCSGRNTAGYGGVDHVPSLLSLLATEQGLRIPNSWELSMVGCRGGDTRPGIWYSVHAVCWLKD
ncbi:uncharacterized protein PG998_008145 [Apiospora kogelbergensis]|uniref:uncharacterized protein n=1 Tax=Apiospora kogelbergensis TaxID=1337665 RepID=UPI00313205AF